MRSMTVTVRLMVAVVAVVAIVGCDGDEEARPSGSPSPGTQTASHGDTAEAADLDELLARCDEDVTDSAELAANAARRSMGAADPHGEGEEEPDPGSTAEAARREARRAARTAADAVDACLRRTTELAAEADHTPDRRMALVQSRLRDLSRALGMLEQALQQGEAINERARQVTEALEGWRRLTAPLRPGTAPSDPSPTETERGG